MFFPIDKVLVSYFCSGVYPNWISQHVVYILHISVDIRWYRAKQFYVYWKKYKTHFEALCVERDGIIFMWQNLQNLMIQFCFFQKVSVWLAATPKPPLLSSKSFFL